MRFFEVIEEIRSEIERDDRIREEVLPKVRETVRKCSQCIKEVHRQNYDYAETLLDEAYQIIMGASHQVDESPFLSKTRILEVAFQELAEASNVLSILRDGEIVSPQSFGIPSRAYLTGLADAVGELRRAVLDAIRTGNLERGSELLTFMETIFDELNGFDFPNALIPDLRRKCDIARGIVERTRGDLTLAVHQARLIRELQRFEERFEE